MQARHFPSRILILALGRLKAPNSAGPRRHAVWATGLHSSGQPCVLDPNHSSDLDSFVLAAVLPPCFVFLAKKEFEPHRLPFRFLAPPRHHFRRALPRRTGASRMLRPPSRLFPSARASLFIPKAHFGATGLRPFKIGGFRVAAHAISWRWMIKTCFRCVGRRACRTDKTLSHMRQSLALIVDKRWACADSLPDGGDSSSSRSGFPGLGEHSLQGHAMVTKKFFPSHFPVSDQ